MPEGRGRHRRVDHQEEGAHWWDPGMWKPGVRQVGMETLFLLALLSSLAFEAGNGEMSWGKVVFTHESMRSWERWGLWTQAIL